MKVKVEHNINVFYKLKMILTVVVITLFFSCDKEDFSDVYEKPGYAVGTITRYISIPLKVTYYYDFKVGDTTYGGEEIAKGIGQLDRSLVGVSFLVVYKLSDIYKNDLNFRYGINNESEFEELVKSFENNPPKPD